MFERSEFCIRPEGADSKSDSFHADLSRSHGDTLPCGVRAAPLATEQVRVMLNSAMSILLHDSDARMRMPSALF